MNKTKILITTVGGVTSPDIIKSLKKKNIYIYGVDKNKNAVGKFFVNKFLLMPDSKNNKLKFIKKIVSIIKKYRIDFIIPCGNDDNIAFYTYRKYFNIPILNSLEYSGENYFQKKLVFEKLKKTFPEVCPNFKSLEVLPKNYKFKSGNFIIKPSLNTGGRGVFFG